MNDATAKSIRLLKDGSLPIWTDAGILGYPVFVSADMPSPGANNKSLMFISPG
jgi:HK97 family phage major capsid protein